MPTVNNTPIVFIVLQPYYSIAEKDSKYNNRPQKTVCPQVEILTFFPNISSR